VTVQELIDKLVKFPSTHEVVITDGYEANCYGGDFAVQLFNDGDSEVVDIGIGGCLQRG
jgi:hypothetical protein